MRLDAGIACRRVLRASTPPPPHPQTYSVEEIQRQSVEITTSAQRYGRPKAVCAAYRARVRSHVLMQENDQAGTLLKIARRFGREGSDHTTVRRRAIKTQREAETERRSDRPKI